MLVVKGRNDEVAGQCTRPVRLSVNGEEHVLYPEARLSLLDALRLDLGLFGTKKGCNEGACGACTVLLDGIPVYSCMVLAAECEGKAVETVEGLSRDGRLHPLQQAFIDEDASQCGFCTPGQLMTAKAFLRDNPDPTEDEVRAAMSGNLCRCGTYPKIVKAVLRAAAVMRQDT